MIGLIRLLVAHRNRLFRDCLVSALSTIEGFEARGVDHVRLGSWRPLPGEAAEAFVFLLDLSLSQPDAADLIGWIRQSVPDAKVIVLVSPTGHENLSRCLEGGIRGCLGEECSIEEVQTAIKKVVAGELFCSPDVAFLMFNKLAQAARRSPWRKSLESVGVTPRELQILKLISHHLGNKQIAKRLGLSLYTVKNHVHTILDKLQVGDRAEAVEYSRRRRWISSLPLSTPSNEE